MKLEDKLTQNAEENKQKNIERANRVKLVNMIKAMSEEDKRYIIVNYPAEILLDELLRQFKIYKDKFGKARELFRVDKVEGDDNVQSDFLRFISDNPYCDRSNDSNT